MRDVELILLGEFDPLHGSTCNPCSLISGTEFGAWGRAHGSMQVSSARFVGGWGLPPSPLVPLNSPSFH